MKYNKRFIKNYIIYPTFQFQVMGISLVVAFGVVALIYFRLAQSYQRFFEVGVKAGLQPGSGYFKLLESQKSLVLNDLYWAMLWIFISTFIFSIFISHKMVGPIYRLKKFFADIESSNDVQELKFRKGDFFGDLPQIINETIKRILKK